MTTPTIAIVFFIINLMYIVAQLIVVGVAIYFWRRYPRPSLYLTIMGLLEVGGSLLQSSFQMLMNWGALTSSNVLLYQVVASTMRFGTHILAMCFLVAAVYVARRPSMTGVGGLPPTSEAPGMEGRDQAYALDPANPYTPPRQPR